MGFPGVLVVKNSSANAGDSSQSLGCEDPLEKKLGNSLLYSCLGNPMGRGAWWVTVHGVAKSWT